MTLERLCQNSRIVDDIYPEEPKCYPNGQVKKEYTVVDGKLEGTFQSFYENGNPHVCATYRNGVRTGLCVTYYANGNIKEKATYADGFPNGLQECYFENGNPKSRIVLQMGIVNGIIEEYYSDRGQLEERGTISSWDAQLNPIFEGIYESRYDNGQLSILATFAKKTEQSICSACTYKKMRIRRHGPLEGVYKEFTPTGIVTDECYFRDGKRYGLRKRFHPNGQKHSKAYYVDGKKNGACIVYVRGIRRQREHWFNGKREGPVEYYDKTGQLSCFSTNIDGCRTTIVIDAPKKKLQQQN